MPPVTSENVAEPTENEALAALELAELKNRASVLGLQFHPSIGEATLRSKIQEHMAKLDELARERERKRNEEEGADIAGVEPPEGAEPRAMSEEQGRKLAARESALALQRVRITCMDPAKKEYEGEIFSAGNSVVGTVKRFVPFNAEWHVERILLNMIQGKHYQAFIEVRAPGGGKIKQGKQVRAYAVEVLPALTEAELSNLRQRQLMARGTAEA